MIYAYEDEDNAPMVLDLPLPYPVRTWEEIQEEWNRRENDGEWSAYDQDPALPG